MSTPLVKLNEHINQLVIWLRDNPGAKLRPSQKEHLICVLNKIINGEALSDKDVRQIEESMEERRINHNSGYIGCQSCGDRCNRHDIDKHKRKCRGYKKGSKSTTQKTPSTAKGSKNGTSPVSNYPTYQRNPYAELREEKYLDGSRGYHVKRDNGEFGSYPSYDNMGDESYS